MIAKKNSKKIVKYKKYIGINIGTQEFINYIEPLIQGDYPPFMVNGLPQHLVLKK